MVHVNRERRILISLTINYISTSERVKDLDLWYVCETQDAKMGICNH